MTQGVIDKVYDNCSTNEEGVFIFNYAFDLVDGKRLYCREKLDPVPKSGNKISYDVINVKTSANGNQYTNIKDLVVMGENSQTTPQTTNNKFDNLYKDRLIFVTSAVGRGMGSGNFSEEKIDILTERAVASFNKHLAK